MNAPQNLQRAILAMVAALLWILLGAILDWVFDADGGIVFFFTVPVMVVGVAVALAEGR